MDEARGGKFSILTQDPSSPYDTLSRRYLLKCLATSSSPEALERARESCCRFQKAVEQVGSAILHRPGVDS